MQSFWKQSTKFQIYFILTYIKLNQLTIPLATKVPVYTIVYFVSPRSFMMTDGLPF